MIYDRLKQGKTKFPAMVVRVDPDLMIVESLHGRSTIKHPRDITNVVLYSCVSHSNLLLFGDRDLWVIYTWNRKVVKMVYDGVTIYKLSEVYDPTVWALFDYLKDRGIAPGSLSSMSLKLWRSTLTDSVRFKESAPMLGRLAIHGGRKECRIGSYSAMRQYDLPAAYPTAMSSAPIPLDLISATPCLPSEAEGVAYASVKIPPLPWGPIPVALPGEVTCYGYTSPTGSVRGYWTLGELRMAREYGCSVRVLDLRVAGRSADVFGRWGRDVVPELRSLPNGAGTLGKVISNRLWGMFAMSESGGGTVTFKRGKPTLNTNPQSTQRAKAFLGESAYVAAIVSARVRERVYREVLSVRNGIVYVDTDGIIGPVGVCPNGWVVKRRIRTLTVAGPQAYSYRCDKCMPPPHGDHDGPHLSIAGAVDRPEAWRVLVERGESPMTPFNTSKARGLIIGQDREA